MKTKIKEKKNEEADVFFLSPLVSMGASPSLPPWVDKVVARRVNDLLSEARRYERQRDFTMAIDRCLEAVRLSPSHPGAREALLRSNYKGLKVAERSLEKKRKMWVRDASDRYRAQAAWRDA